MSNTTPRNTTKKQLNSTGINQQKRCAFTGELAKDTHTQDETTTQPLKQSSKSKNLVLFLGTLKNLVTINFDSKK
jgi:hypothetical protein